MREFIREIVHSLEAGQGAELVSVVESGGSTPRGAGALMAVFPDGRTAGTIGGGNVEYEAQTLAKALLAEGGQALRHFRFVQGDAASLGMVCGGDVTLQFQYLPGGDTAAITVLRALLDASGKNADIWLVRRLEGDGWPPWIWRAAPAAPGCRGFLWTSCKTRRCSGTAGLPSRW